MSILNINSEKITPDNSFFEKYVDNVIESADEFDMFLLHMMVETFQVNKSDKIILSSNVSGFEKFLIRLKLVELNKKFNLNINLTDFGRDCKKNGGYFIYLNILNNKDQKEEERQNRKDKIDQVDFLTKKWSYKFRYLLYVASFGGLAVSIFTYFKNAKEPKNLSPMRQEIQEVKSKMKVIDSLFRVDTLLKKRMK